MKIPTLKRYDLIEIVLTDLTARLQWHDVADVENDTAWIIHMVGYYINHDKDQVRVSGLRVPSDEKVGDVHFVPIQAITSVRKLR